MDLVRGKKGKKGVEEVKQGKRSGQQWRNLPVTNIIDSTENPDPMDY